MYTALTALALGMRMRARHVISSRPARPRMWEGPHEMVNIMVYIVHVLVKAPARSEANFKSVT